MSESQQQIRIVGFDLDGTLYSSTPEIQRRIRKLIYEKISKQVEISIEEAENLFEIIYNEIFSGSETLKRIGEKFGKELDTDIVQRAIEEANILELLKPNPQLQEMLERLAKERGLDLITTSEYYFALKKLERLEINPEIFDYIMTRENGSKSSGEIYKNWIKKRNLNPEQFLYVGDNPKQDIEAPKKLGIRTCYIGERNSKADFHIENILDLESLLIN